MDQQEVLTLSQSAFISNDPETSGFDLSSGSKWIYPENYPRRDYQFSIVQTALYNNTLVCLPTGLGKTFIAAVVMYNFWRWYPRGRVVFLAPTKPLVAQQIQACHEIMGIPSEQTIELTGAINQNKRRQAWTQKRVIFATPQTFQKDLQNDCVPCDLIKCVVIDEAHKSLGKHSYCEIVNMLNAKNKFFRVLALSATPGSKIDQVREVIQNLLISELELRDDASPDIIPYTNDRSMEKIIVGLGKDLNDFKERYLGIMDPHVRVLMKCQLIQGNAANISKGRIFMIMKQVESRPQKLNNHGVIMKTLNILLTMYHAYELLIKHGLRAFYNFYSNHSDKFWLEAEVGLHQLLEEIKTYVGDFPMIQASPDVPIPEIPENLVFGHGKFSKLRELLVNHFELFSRQNKSTRAIVFVEYRDIVNEVYVLLLQTRPLIRPQMFVGQAGQKQKQQLAALEDFRNNKVNVLISTSVGEEGLDVGEVDLIVCFDISTSTPTRLVQRMGRTGRKRSGRVVLLLTEGKEVQTFNQAMSKKESLNSKVLQSSNIASSLYQSSPRMIPTNITPECLPIFIKTQPKTPKAKTKKTKVTAEKKPRKKKDQANDEEHPVEKKSRKKKDQINDEEHLVQPSTSKIDPHIKSVNSSQSSMMKFLTKQHHKKKPQSSSEYRNNYDSDSGILCEEFQNPENKFNSPENPYAVIRPSEVKLLTSDNHAVDFLILCAMKKSEQETKDDDVINIDDTWIPQHSVPIDALRDFVVPSVDTLDCIKDLTLFDKPIDDLEISNTDYVQNLLDNNVDTLVNNSESNFFEELSNSPQMIESKYTKSWDDQIRHDDDEMIESHFFDNFTVVESKYISSSEIKSNNVEVPSDFFDNDFCTFDSKYVSSKESYNANLNKQKEFEHNPDNFINEKSDEFSETKDTTIQTPAHIEMDFENILDEGTESEASESHALIDDHQESNIYDELLDADSADDDIFESSQEQNVTVISNNQNDETLVNRKSLTKRSASRSPEKESPLKKQKIEIDSSDNESAIVMGTPPKIKDRSFLNTINEVTKPMPEVVYPDSDQDLFEEFDLETQFSFTEEKDKLPCLKEKEDKSCNDEENIKTSIEENKICIGKEKNEVSNNNKTYEESSEIENNETLNHTKKSITELNEYVLEDFDMTILDNELEQNISEQEQIKNESLTNNFTNVTNANAENINDCNFTIGNIDDWKDDFDLTSVTVEKDKIAEETFSNYFSKNSKTTSAKSRSQETPSSSSGWISVDNTKSLDGQPKKVLSLKTMNPKIPSKLNLKNLITASTSEKQSDMPGKDINDPKIFTALNSRRPNLSSLSLKRNLGEGFKQDKDGFLLPQITSKVSNELKSKIIASKSEKACRDKENKLPKFKDKRKRDNNISPRFRKYHSENNLSIRKREKKTKSRKRILNDFIEDEAEISSDIDTSEGSSDDDDENDLNGFVSYTQDIPDPVDMTAHYLRTMNNSPIRVGAFMFKEVKNHIPEHEIYSQPVSQSQLHETYLHDSFCVGDETEHQVHDNDSDSSLNDSVIDDVEPTLGSRRRRMRSKRELKFQVFKNSRRRKNKRDSSSNSDNKNSSSSEDETEALRRQILEESMLMKRSKH